MNIIIIKSNELIKMAILDLLKTFVDGGINRLTKSFMCFNSIHSKFVTCGEDGEIHSYSLNQNGEIQYLGFANLFKQAIICVSWASPSAGGRLAVAGSQGTFCIVHVDDKNGEIVVEKSLRFNQSVPVSMDWHPNRKLLLCGTNDGHITSFSLVQHEWTNENYFSINKKTPVEVGWGSTQNQYRIIAFDNKIYKIDNTQGNSFKMKQMLKLKEDAKIGRMLVYNEGIPNRVELLVFTKESMLVCKIMPSSETLVAQSIDISKSNITQINWGWNKSQIICYAYDEQDMMDQQNKNAITNPILFRRQINGMWKQAQ